MSPLVLQDSGQSLGSASSRKSSFKLKMGSETSITPSPLQLPRTNSGRESDRPQTVAKVGPGNALEDDDALDRLSGLLRRR